MQNHVCLIERHDKGDWVVRHGQGKDMLHCSTQRWSNDAPEEACVRPADVRLARSLRLRHMKLPEPNHRQTWLLQSNFEFRSAWLRLANESEAACEKISDTQHKLPLGAV